MIDLLKQIGVPTIWLLIVAISFVLIKEIWSITKTKRAATFQLMLSKAIDERDKQLQEFYLPIRSRLELSNHLFEVTRNWQNPESKKFDNQIIEIRSNDERALSKIVNNRLFLPLNKDVEDIIINKISMRHPNDKTNYLALLSHFILWRVFEESANENEIQSYNGASFLQFPSKEAEIFYDVCEILVDERDKLYSKLLKLESSSLLSHKIRRNK